MPFDDLRQWIAALDRAGELKRIQTEVDPILEIAEITDRVSKGASRTNNLAGTASSPVPPNHERANLAAQPYYSKTSRVTLTPNS